jgi:hypothetical protein
MGSRRLLSAIAAALVALPLVASSAAPAPAHRRSCSSGASSIRAHLVDGRVVVSSPARSGCNPATR